MVFHVLRHVDADERLLVVEEELRQRPGQLRLADARRAQEHERADGPLWVLEPRPSAPYRVRDHRDRLVLADDACVQRVLHMQQPLSLRLQQPADGHTRPYSDQLRDVVLAHHHVQLLVGQPRVALGDGVVLHPHPLGAQLRCPLVVGAIGGGLFQVLQLGCTTL